MISNQEGATNICATKRSSLKDLFGKSCTLEIRFINKVFGEGLFASADIPENKVIFSCFPYCCAFFPDYKQIRCCYCGKEGKSTECETCQSVVYCSEQCKNLDKQYHAKLFHQEQEVSSTNQVCIQELNPDVILLDKAINLLLSGSNGEFSSNSSFAPSRYEPGDIIHLNELPVPNASEISVVLFRNDHFQTIQTVFTRNESLFTEELMNKILQVFDADLSRRQVSADFIANQQITFYQACNGFSLVQSRAFFILTRLLRKLYNNRVTIRTHQMDPCGFGVYPVVSCINHHCRPNAAFVFNGNRLLLTSIRRIKSSEEITVRYMDSYRVPRIKEMLIQKRFGFDCHCSFCYSDHIERESQTCQCLLCPFTRGCERCSGIQIPELFMNNSLPLKYTCSVCSGVMNTMECMDSLIPYSCTLEYEGFLDLQGFVERVKGRCERNETELLHDLKGLNVSMSSVCDARYAELIQVRLLLFRLYFKMGKLAAALEFGEYIKDVVQEIEQLYPEYLGFVEIMAVIFNKLGVQINKKELLEELDSLRKKFYGNYYDKILV